ncbi:MAG: glycoside hydrolase, partial [Planctomycetia bacterium]|nr:glycoside hydrolase [Planctomycetia bacterium]
MNEGISFPVEEEAPHAERLHTYGGHGLCMAFFGVVRDVSDPSESSGFMAILETPDDAAVLTRRYIGLSGSPDVATVDGSGSSEHETPESLLSCAPQWVPQCGTFGYERRIRYVFLDQGGYVGICKRYREYVKQIGLVVPFTEKVRRNPSLREGLDRLIGAANVWNWEEDRVGLVKELRSAGIERILWSGGGTAEEIAAMNALPGVLTSRYDIYQDVMDPAQFDKLPGVHGDWVTSAWPEEIILNADGSWRRGWEVTQKDPTQPRIPCGVICDSRALPYAERRISDELKTKPYRARFLDTTTAAPWQDCYHPAHPMTRSDSKRWKMKLLGMVGERFHLVCGSETGHEASVPFCDFYEGMMSLGPYRVADSGRDMMRKWDDVPELVEKYQLGEAYRLPLWELVYHDCTVSYWYWGDYNNKLPSLWRKRDLFNALYGVPPMYMFTRAEWNRNRDRFVESYRIASPVARLTGRSEMTDHRILSSDRTIQRSTFANGTVVTVNFRTGEYSVDRGGDDR